MGDEAVQATNDDATLCKVAAVQLGYWDDPFIKCFSRGRAQRKAPEINRGYWGRVNATENAVAKFLQLCPTGAQIVNLGAGYDTLYWKITQQRNLHPACFVELDFSNVTSKKCFTIRNNPLLLQPLNSDDDVRFSQTSLHGNNYHLVATDLRDLESVKKAFTESGLCLSSPTLFISECVLVYMPSEGSQRLLQGITDMFTDALFLFYEQINMDDNFGDTMLRNLHARGCQLLGIDRCLSMESQVNRFTATGWQGATVKLMTDVYNELQGEEKYRIEKLEFLDDADIFKQLLHHYCMGFAWKDESKHNFEFANFI